MKKIKNNITFLNIFSNLFLQFVTIISGFIIPHTVLNIFGSEVNGLVSSLTQFLNYISLFEGGLGGVVLANLYGPLYSKDKNKISSVVKTTQKFYNKLSLYFIFYTVIIALIYPLITNNNFSYIYIFTLTLILSITLFIQYNFSLSYKLLLQADKKVYIVSFTQSFLTIINVILFTGISKVLPNIHILKLISASIFILQPLIFNFYVKKHYSIDRNVSTDPKLLKSRWDGFAINIAAFIHNNTDITVLTVFTNLKIVSVYSIYSLFTTGLKKLIQSISSAIGPSVGHLYASGNKVQLDKKFELYEYTIFFITFYLFVIGGLLITPFVLIYTKNIIDINYNQKLFGILIVIAELIYCIREPYVTLAYSANKFKEMKKHAYIEAVLNILISIILVINFGLIGVAIGTIIAMSYRTLYQVYYLKNNIIYRSPYKFIYKFIVFGILSFIGILLCNIFIPINKINIINLIIHGILYSSILFVIYVIGTIIFMKKDFVEIKKIIK